MTQPQSSVDGIELPDDAPEPPDGFGAWSLTPADQQERYNCLCCDEGYLTDDELMEHVREVHTPRDVYTALQPINLPSVVWFTHADIDILTNAAAKYARKVVPDDQLTGRQPNPAKRVANSQCPVCGDAVDSTAPQLRSESHHDVETAYTYLRNLVPDEYEYSPVFDDAGYDDPAGQLNKLQPGDVVYFTADGWQQSLGTPRGQTRDKISDEDEWAGKGRVRDIEDSRVDSLPGVGMFSGDDGIHREVTIVGEIDLVEDEVVTVTMTPKEDGSIRLEFKPQVSQQHASDRHGHGGAGLTRSKITQKSALKWESWDS